MTQVDEIEKLQIELASNPKSAEFTRLAELYLGRELVTEAEQLVTQSLKFHPRSVSGLILLGRIFKIKKNLEAALFPLSEATKLAPENWRAWAEMGEAFLEMKKAKQALSSFKKVLFLNPTHPLARKAVAKLEVLTADEYDEDLFQMQQLPETHLTQPTLVREETGWTATPDGLMRIISYIDALIIRNEQQKAIDLLNDCTKKYGSHPEIDSRRLQLSSYEKSAFIQPKLDAQSKTRRHVINEKKMKALKELLRRIESQASHLLST
ncbi:MAG: hypothetical protein H7328_11455 [Bdellovibrio sp.]|nr:hypothetical protein [Bdellovibrio sp.]